MDDFLAQLDKLLDEFDDLVRSSKHKDLSDIAKHVRQGLLSRSFAAVERIAGQKSSYARDIKRILEQLPLLHEHTTSVMGVVQGMRDDVKAGYISSLVELVHGEVFADFLEMAEHLQSSKFKDAAAVIAGSALEAHLRALCVKHAIETVDRRSDGSEVAKKADRLNNDLASATVYSKLYQKSVTGWLDLRNKAAHGHYSEYSPEQVGLLIEGVREFMARNPA